FLTALAGAGVALLLVAYKGHEALVAWSALRAAPLLGALGLAAALTGSSFLVGWDRLLGRLLLVAAGLAGPLLLVVVAYQLVALADGSGPLGEGLLWVALVGTLAYAFLALDINLLSPHRYYRDQLAKTYLIHRTGGDCGVARVDPQPLSKLAAE